jgi:hypothetical protein
MAGYKDLGFNERRAAAQQARETALAQLKARPPIDEAEQAKRRTEAEARKAAQDEQRAAKKAAQQEVALAEAEQADQAAARAAGAVQLTEEQRKAARDAKYAARKKNKAKR